MFSHYLNHVPLLLCLDVEHTGKQRFIFQPFWTKCTSFFDLVERAWHCPLRNVTPFVRLNCLLHNTIGS
jgi:hypothetical protein